MGVNRNTVTILTALVAGEGSASVEELCRSLGVTRQLLLYYVGTLNDSLLSAGFSRAVLRGDRISIAPVGAEELRALMDAYSRGDYSFVREERRDLMTLMMALHPSPVTIGRLCDFFSISRTTATSDIALLRAELAREGLGLVSLGRGGYRVEGDERVLRWRVMDSFYRLDSAVTRRVARSSLLLGAREVAGEREAGGSPDIALQVERALRSAVARAERETGSTLSYSLLGELVFYLVVVVLRNRVAPRAAATPVLAIRLEGTPEWGVAEYVMGALARLGLPIDASERPYVAAMLRGARVYSPDDLDNASDQRSVEIVRLLVGEFERQVCTTIEGRDAFMGGLLPHVRAMVCRIAYAIKLPSVVSRHVRESYRQLYNATNLVCKNLEERLGMVFPPDEVAGLCVYFGSQSFGDHNAGDDLAAPFARRRVLIVCPAGIGTSLLVRQQLRDLLGPGFDFEACDLRACASVDASAFDLVVSTVDVPELEGRVLRVSASLTRSQERRLLDWSVRSSMARASVPADVMGIIERYVDDDDALSLLGELSRCLGGGGFPRPPRELRLLDILPASRIQVTDAMLSADEAVRLGCAPLVRDGIVTDAYADKIMQTIDELGLYSEYRPEILVAHARPGPESREIGMSLTICRHPIAFARWGRSYRVIFTLAATDSERHVPAMRDLMALLSSEPTCEELRGWSEDTPEALYLYLGAQLSERGA